MNISWRYPSSLTWALLALLLFAAIRANGQSALDSYIEEGLRNNEQLLQEALAVQDRQLALSEANANFLPQVQFMADYTLADGGRTIDIPVGDLLNPVYGSLNELTASNRFPTITNVSEQFLPNDFHETKLRLIQPLFNTDIYYNRQINRYQLEAAEARRAAYEQELVKEIKVAYYNYLQAQSAVDIYESNKEPLYELVRFNELRYREDLVTQDEVYRSEFEVEQLLADQADARAQLETARVYFNFLLNRPYDKPIEVDTAFTLPATQLEPQVADAIGRRSEIRQIQAAQEAQQQAYNLNRASRFLPTINAVGDLGYQGFEYTFDDNQDFWFVNFSLRWDLFTGSRQRYATQRSRIQLDVLESQEDQLESQISVEVVRAQADLMASQKRYTAKTKSVQAAQRTFAITQSRYRENQALLIEFLDAQSAYLSAQIDQSISKYQWLTNQAQLERAIAYR